MVRRVGTMLNSVVMYEADILPCRQTLVETNPDDMAIVLKNRCYKK